MFIDGWFGTAFDIIPLYQRSCSVENKFTFIFDETEFNLTHFAETSFLGLKFLPFYFKYSPLGFLAPL